MANYNHGTIKNFGLQFISDMGIQLPEELKQVRIESIIYKAEIGKDAYILINNTKVESRDFFGVKSASWDRLIASLNYEKFLEEMPLTSIEVNMRENEACKLDIKTLMVGCK